jgi:toxin ParE1/3/4
MAQIRWTPQAAEDLKLAAEFIEKDSPHYANLFVIDILASVERLTAFPELGRIVPESSNSSVRELFLGNYRIIYRLHQNVVQILTIYHGLRLLDPRLLK